MSDAPTHAVTQPQPLAWALCGPCPIVNSDTRPGLEHVGKLIGIHAGKRAPSLMPDGSGIYRYSREGLPPDLRIPTGLVFGALVGVARLVGVVQRDASRVVVGAHVYQVMRGRAVAEDLSPDRCRKIAPWWRGPWGWLLEDTVALPEPIPMRGAGGLWRLPTAAGFAGLRAADGRWWATVAEWALEQWRKGRGAEPARAGALQ